MRVKALSGKFFECLTGPETGLFLWSWRRPDTEPRGEIEIVMHETTPAQQAAIDQQDRSERSLARAQHRLETALRAAQPGRAKAWATAVQPPLEVLREALAHHSKQMLGPEGLYGELESEAPHLTSRVRQVERQLLRITREAEDLAREIELVTEGTLGGLPGIRGDAERLLRAIRDLMSKENDLIFEQFEEPPALD